MAAQPAPQDFVRVRVHKTGKLTYLNLAQVVTAEVAQHDGGLTLMVKMTSGEAFSVQGDDAVALDRALRCRAGVADEGGYEEMPQAELRKPTQRLTGYLRERGR